LELAVFGLLVCAAIGIPAGVLAADKRGSGADHAIGLLTLLGPSVPNFALGPALILVFSVLIGWLPVSGRAGYRISSCRRLRSVPRLLRF
jgi:ABC-type dipeptide/oligopeptide/nickel transport system permease component